MFSAMLDHVVSPLESLPTNVADVRSFRGVRNHMGLPHVGRPKVLLAHVTRERLDVRVCSHVGHEISLRGEDLAAILASVGLIVLLHVIVQVLLREQSFVTHDALKFVIVQMRHLHVFVQGVAAGVEPAAAVAHVRRIIVGTDVELEVPLDLKSLAAMLARELVVVRVLPDVVGLKVVLCLCSVIALVAAVKLRSVHLLVDHFVRLQVALVLECL